MNLDFGLHRVHFHGSGGHWADIIGPMKGVLRLSDRTPSKSHTSDMTFVEAL